MLGRLTKITNINWNNLTKFGGNSTLTLALRRSNSKIIKAILAIPQIIYDVYHLRDHDVYDEAVSECKKYLSELSGGSENDIESLVEFAVERGLYNMAKFLAKSTTRSKRKNLTLVSQAAECVAKLIPIRTNEEGGILMPDLDSLELPVKLRDLVKTEYIWYSIR